ncbi:MAG: biotin--[acetyl-CoA-carboxylase] ligase [Bacteroidales bacterium]
MKDILIKWYKSIDSTNLEAERNLSVTNDFSVLAAEFQTAGRGQRGNHWESAEGENLTFSIVLKPKGLKAVNQFVISEVVSVGICDYLKNYEIEAQIKWPNDIYVGNKKICGILIENKIFTDRLAASIVGIGLNLNQTEFISDARNPTSLLLSLTDRVFSQKLNLKDELLLIVESIYKNYLPLLKEEQTTILGDKCINQENSHTYPKNSHTYPPQIEKRYLSLLYQKDIWCNYESLIKIGELNKNQIFEAKIIGVNKKTACLEVELHDKQHYNFAFKEISFL